ncbi:MAG: 5-formyltetrahydrofolate cyclo-ligase [Treponema sp.]|jgi:5-formyltetrahydrofolate cyclo-ligase|nr:5-formyltetrahydrofolate cyclo-ligase [Treponema sp.]
MRRDNPDPKSLLRRIIKKRLSLLSPGDFRTQGEAAAVLLRKSPLWTRYGTIFLFLSLPDEIDTRPLLETALDAGKRIFAPRIEPCENGRGCMKFYRVFSREIPCPVPAAFPGTEPGLGAGPFGIREPPPVEPPGPADFPALILVPGLAFDARGRRLGRGGAYYDRFLAALEQGAGPAKPRRIIGLCMPCQLVRKVPVEHWDRRVDGVCTGDGFFKIPQS